MASGRSPRLIITTLPAFQVVQATSSSQLTYFKSQLSDIEIVYATLPHNHHVSLRHILLLASHRGTKALKIRQSSTSSVSFDCFFALHYDTCSYCFSTGLCRISNIARQPYQGLRSSRKGSLLAHNTERRNPFANGLSSVKLLHGTSSSVEERERSLCHPVQAAR